MKKKKQPGIVSRLVGGASWVSVVALWLCAASVYVNPSFFRFIGVVGLAFPFFLAGAAFMLAVSLLFAPRRAWISLVGIMGCFFTVRSYCPLNLPSPPPRGCIKFMSYNTLGFGSREKDSLGRNVVAAYMAASGADIICVQEAGVPDDAYKKDILPLMRRRTPYFDSLYVGHNVLACFSAYPIVGKELVCKGVDNGSVAFRVLLAPEDTLLVVNNHLESMHLSQEDRTQYRDMVRSPEETEVKSGSVRLVSKISRAAVERARQADIVAEYIECHKGENMIVCGDFNDTPVSYARRRIAEGLTDAYVSTANGIGRSFNRDAIIVRIDNIFCSSHWKPFACKVDQSIASSDHYPIYAYLKRVGKK